MPLTIRSVLLRFYGMVQRMTSDTVRDMVEILRVSNVQPIEGDYIVTLPDRVADDLFLLEMFPSWFQMLDS